MLKTALIKSYLFLPQLKAIELNIFRRKCVGEGKYLEYIPLTWTACNNLGAPTSTAILWDMMIIYMLKYQADEYMEAVVGVHFEHNLGPVKSLIERLRQTSRHGPPSRKRARSGSEEELNIGLTTLSNSSSEKAGVSLADVEHVLLFFINYVLTHPKAVASPPAIRIRLRQELADFLLTRVTQIEDNARLGRQTAASSGAPNSHFHTSNRTYYDWVHTTFANHTSCPYSFVFFVCLTSTAGESCFRTVKQKYLAGDLCRRLATLCRQYNDYGSIARDHAEKNLNSVDFPELNTDLRADGAMKEAAATGALIDKGALRELREVREVRKKEDLFWLAEYERECLERVVIRLEQEVPAAIMDRLRLFVNVADLYGQIYVARDVGNWTK